MRGCKRMLVVAVAVIAAIALSAGAAEAAINPSVSLDQSAGTAAAGSHDLGLTIDFHPTGSDTPNQLTIQLPPGLIANATVDHGACLTTPAPASRSSTPPAQCQVGTGTAQANAIVIPGVLSVPATIDLTYYLVAPPKPADLAGLYVTGQIKIAGFLPLTTISLGTGDVFLRPTGDPDGVGLTISLALPQQAAGLTASVSSIASTFKSLRYPSSCPATPAQVKISATSYGAPSTVRRASAPLTVTGCGSAPYSPRLAVNAVKDAGDNQVRLTATIAQANALGALASDSTALTFPTTVLAPNLGVAGALCRNPSSGSCTPIGSATAVSPVYPTALTGKAYLTGGLNGLGITLVFPSPFPLTLTGSVNLTTNTTTFAGLPDIPLSSLRVTLDGGPEGAFATTCTTATGTATAALASAGGSRKASASDRFTVAGWKPCAGAPPGKGGGGSGTGGHGGGSGTGGGHGRSAKRGSGTHGRRPTLSGGSIRGLIGGRPALRFTVSAGADGAKLQTLTIGLTDGLRFLAHGHKPVDGVTVTGAKASSDRLSHGRLVLALRKPARSATVTLSHRALREDRQLRARAAHHKLSHVQVDVTVKDTSGRVSRLRMQIHKLGLTVALAASAPAAPAAITPAVSSPQTAPVQAGATGSLSLDLTFSATGADTPRQLTLNLPPGLLTSAAIDGGGCLQTTDIETDTCQIGSGVVTADLGDATGVATPVGFFLVPPPAAGDLAGLAVATGGQQIGTTAPIVIRPSGDPDGVGASIELTLPNTLAGQSLQITEIDSTFDGLRFPATCPATPARITVAANSYADPTVKTAALALPVSGCGSLPYAPKYGLSVTRDNNDRQVTVVTQVTQTPAEAPSSSLTLGFPTAVLAPALGGLGDLCANVASGTCKPVGSVTAASPLYPKPLTGSAYLTGSTTNLSGLTLTLVFPPPFPLTLVGKVDLKNLSTTFSGLPDIPLTSLQVTLDGGKSGLFLTLCSTRSGTSTLTATDQNGDKHTTENAPFTVSGCPAGTGAGSGGGSGSGGAAHPGKPTHPGKPKVTGATVAGLATGRPVLRFTARAGSHAPKLSSLTVTVPNGLRLVARRVHGRARLAVGVHGARLASATVAGRKLVVRLRKPAARATVKLGHGGLTESTALEAKAKRIKWIKLTVVARDASGGGTRVHARVRVIR